MKNATYLNEDGQYENEICIAFWCDGRIKYIDVIYVCKKEVKCGQYKK
jgi:hypothetical protein